LSSCHIHIFALLIRTSGPQIRFHFRFDSISTSDPYMISFLIHFLFI
jgi:hypothetical protein